MLLLYVDRFVYVSSVHAIPGMAYRETIYEVGFFHHTSFWSNPICTELGTKVASRAFVYTNAQNGLPALPPEVRFCLLGQRPKPYDQPLPGLAARSETER